MAACFSFYHLYLSHMKSVNGNREDLPVFFFIINIEHFLQGSLVLNNKLMKKYCEFPMFHAVSS